ncbi:Uncharacterised protein [Nocardia otitidiscaviarum]|uniref:Uncharacterized protein n=1 Tax=Nocardia otitidiscaviarum TaxID=1823 RepID=A0A378YSE2_9NOCA|nr:hypothetical protein [Nocardia otitidiscaviarum]SUA79309.1 Uncharacterised protein [Nocardia otitidiscaviarum]
MTDDRLTLSERCVLLVLMAEARELTNAELSSVAGIKLDGRYRRHLNDLGLVSSALVGRAYVHELTDKGAVWCAEELARQRPARSGCAGGALYAVLAGLRRYLDDSGQVLADVFRPDVPGRVESAYADLSRGGGTPVRLAALRERLAELPRGEVDRALELLARRPHVHVRAEADQKTLTAADHAAAVVLGGTPRHLLTIEAAR